MQRIVNITHLSYNGMGVGVSEDGEEVWVLGAFPGEISRAEVYGRRSGRLYAVVSEVIVPSPFRIQSKEDHYLMTSPWQTITYVRENEMKRDLVKRIWNEAAGVDVGNIDIIFNKWEFSYRNRMEFNVIEQDGKCHLGLFKRGRREVVLVAESALAMECINSAAYFAVDSLNKRNIASQDIKGIIIRANRNNEVVVGLLLTAAISKITSKQPFFAKNRIIKGLQVYYSNPQTQRFETTDLLSSNGDDELSEVICGKTLLYGITDFFQINVPLFEQAVERMKPFVKGESAVDYYSGVGTIGIALGDCMKNCILVEFALSMTKKANQNIRNNNCDNTHRAITSRSENMLKYISHAKVVILNPPREGVDSKVIERIAQEKPKRVIYLSCKPYTQARDTAPLLKHYDLKLLELYNNFPRTPHVESLCVLERL